MPQDPDDPADPWVVQAGYQGVRSRFFDEALTGAGTTQVVLLAAGLDARALRLPWPAGTTVFEVDQPKVLDSRTGSSPRRGSRRPRAGSPCRSTCATTGPPRSPPPVSTRPATAWLAEGLLPYLPADAEQLLFERVHALSRRAAGSPSRHFGDQVERIADDPSFRVAAQEMLPGTDVRELFFAEPGPSPATPGCAATAGRSRPVRLATSPRTTGDRWAARSSTSSARRRCCGRPALSGGLSARRGRRRAGRGAASSAPRGRSSPGQQGGQAAQPGVGRRAAHPRAALATSATTPRRLSTRAHRCPGRRSARPRAVRPPGRGRPRRSRADGGRRRGGAPPACAARAPGPGRGRRGRAGAAASSRARRSRSGRSATEPGPAVAAATVAGSAASSGPPSPGTSATSSPGAGEATVAAVRRRRVPRRGPAPGSDRRSRAAPPPTIRRRCPARRRGRAPPAVRRRTGPRRPGRRPARRGRHAAGTTGSGSSSDTASAAASSTVRTRSAVPGVGRDAPSAAPPRAPGRPTGAVRPASGPAGPARRERATQSRRSGPPAVSRTRCARSSHTTGASIRRASSSNHALGPHPVQGERPGTRPRRPAARGGRPPRSTISPSTPRRSRRSAPCGAAPPVGTRPPRAACTSPRVATAAAARSRRPARPPRRPAARRRSGRGRWWGRPPASPPTAPAPRGQRPRRVGDLADVHPAYGGAQCRPPGPDGRCPRPTSDGPARRRWSGAPGIHSVRRKARDDTDRIPDRSRRGADDRRCPRRYRGSPT